MIQQKQLFAPFGGLDIPNDARLVCAGWEEQRVARTEVDRVDWAVMALQRCHIKFADHWGLHNCDWQVLRGCCQFGACVAVPQLSHCCLVQSSFLQKFAFRRDRHGQWLTEVSWDVVDFFFLFGFVWVFQSYRRCAVTRTPDLLFERDRQVCFLQFGWQLTEPSFVRKALVIINGLDLNLVAALCKHWLTTSHTSHRYINLPLDESFSIKLLQATSFTDTVEPINHINNSILQH